MPSLLPKNPAIMLANDTSRLIFNMSVSPEKNSENIRDRGKPRYGLPTLRSFQLYPLVSAVLTSSILPYEDRDPLLPLCPFLCWVGVHPRAQPRPPS